PGGDSSIREIAWDGHAAVVNGERRVIPARPPAAFRATTFDCGAISARLRQGRLRAASRVRDSFGYASGAFAWDLPLTAGGEAGGEVRGPLHPSPPSGKSRTGRPSVARDFNPGLEGARSAWHRRLDRVDIHLPA